MIILIDNGHGDNTLGKRSPVWKDGSQLFEWQFNREIVSNIHKMLTVVGIGSIILIPEYYDVPLSERCKRVNDYYKWYKNIFLLSVHVNAAPEDKKGKGKGWEIWTSKGETKSDVLAEYFCDAALEFLPEFKMRFEKTGPGDGRDKDGNFKILRGTVCPAVLTENLFMDNEKECRFLLSERGKDIITDLHVDAIIKIVRDFNLGRLSNGNN